MSILHNIVHLLFGVAGLALARTVNGADELSIVQLLNVKTDAEVVSDKRIHKISNVSTSNIH